MITHRVAISDDILQHMYCLIIKLHLLASYDDYASEETVGWRSERLRILSGYVANFEATSPPSNTKRAARDVMMVHITHSILKSSRVVNEPRAEPAEHEDFCWIAPGSRCIWSLDSWSCSRQSVKSVDISHLSRSLMAWAI